MLRKLFSEDQGIYFTHTNPESQNPAKISYSIRRQGSRLRVLSKYHSYDSLPLDAKDKLQHIDREDWSYIMSSLHQSRSIQLVIEAILLLTKPTFLDDYAKSMLLSSEGIQALLKQVNDFDPSSISFQTYEHITKTLSSVNSSLKSDEELPALASVILEWVKEMIQCYEELQGSSLLTLQDSERTNYTIEENRKDIKTATLEQTDSPGIIIQEKPMVRKASELSTTTKDILSLESQLEGCINEIKDVKFKDFDELVAYTNPPKDIETALIAAFTLLGQKSDWDSLREGLCDPREFIQKLLSFDILNGSEETYSEARSLLSDTRDYVKPKEELPLAAAAIRQWTYTVIELYDLYKQESIANSKPPIAPKQCSLYEADDHVTIREAEKKIKNEGIKEPVGIMNQEEEKIEGDKTKEQLEKEGEGRNKIKSLYTTTVDIQAAIGVRKEQCRQLLIEMLNQNAFKHPGFLFGEDAPYQAAKKIITLLIEGQDDLRPVEDIIYKNRIRRGWILYAVSSRKMSEQRYNKIKALLNNRAMVPEIAVNTIYEWAISLLRLYELEHIQ